MPSATRTPIWDRLRRVVGRSGGRKWPTGRRRTMKYRKCQHLGVVKIGSKNDKPGRTTPKAARNGDIQKSFNIPGPWAFIWCKLRVQGPPGCGEKTSSRK